MTVEGEGEGRLASGLREAFSYCATTLCEAPGPRYTSQNPEDDQIVTYLNALHHEPI